ncbi:hypothetical protein BJ166DRAFT_238645 [Pestalotiopsis sp. NC0098]|nr:hypothetical protein BJ166DRAFT_238645 [Pestalotiopsis sp. NC0098]
MDALAVAAAVIQFVDFTSGIVSKTISIHSSAAGLAVDQEELETITRSLSDSSDEIRESLGESRLGRRLNRNERDLEKIAVDCQGVADELLEVLDKLSSKGPKTKWRSFRQALRSTWNEGKVRSLEQRLDRFRQQMMANVLNSLRQEADRSLREQSSMRNSVERIEVLQQNSISVGDKFVGQMMDGEQWRRDLLQMIHEQGQSDHSRIANLAAMKDSNGSTPNAVVVQEKRIRDRLLHKLEFRNMADRERRISKAHQRTFDWIFQDPAADSRPWSSFKDFLGDPTNKLYWITGKPGSGKSTLMKYIRHHPQTTKLLKPWGGSENVIQAAFYFWNSGSNMQMSVEGLLQTVLHECLRQVPHVVQEVLSERWEAATLFDVDDFPWNWDELAQALRRLITEACPEKKFFVTIDGLDEYSGNQAQLIEFINELAEDAENLKLCVASRPWSNFEDAFKCRPSLMLQDLSAADIEWYIESKFTSSAGFIEFQLRDPLQAKELLKTISKKAEGVFLWVHLVCQSLLEGLTNGDGLRDLTNRLDELPPNLEDLYANILENLDDKYLDHASRLFQIVRACDDSPTLWRIALADLEDGQRAMEAPVQPVSFTEKSAVCKNMKRKLNSRCRGLLDISSPIVRFHGHRAEDQDPDEPKLTEDIAAVDDIGESDLASLEVQYLHRSVRDYIQSSEMWSWLLSANEDPFDPHLPLLKSHLLSLKSLQPGALSAQELGFHVWMSIKYAKRSLSRHTKKEQADEVVHLLDEMDRSATSLTKSSTSRQFTFVDRRGTLASDHWSSFFLIRVPEPTFLDVMAICGVHQHLEMRLQSSDMREDDNIHGGANDDKMPLIISALEGAPLVPEMEGYRELFGPHSKVLKVLLQKGGDCHKRYQRRSAWDLADRAGFATILELFEEYRGKPPPRKSRNNDRFESRGDKGSDNSPETQENIWDQSESDNESNASTEAVTGRESSIASASAKERISKRVSPHSSTTPNDDVQGKRDRMPRRRSHRSSSPIIDLNSPRSTTYSRPSSSRGRDSSPPLPPSRRMRHRNDHFPPHLLYDLRQN